MRRLRVTRPARRPRRGTASPKSATSWSASRSDFPRAAPGGNLRAKIHLQARQPFRALPLSPKGKVSYRTELSEAFCRRQQALVSGASLRRRAGPGSTRFPG
jgi:hypothetical protein